MKKRYGFLSIAVLLLFIVINVPARFVINQVQSLLPTVQLSQVSGNIWKGQLTADTGKFRVNGVQWDLNGWALLLGQLRVNVRIEDGDLQASVNAKVGLNRRVFLSSGQVQMAASRFEKLLPMKGLQLQGDVQLQLQEAEILGQEIQQINATAEWRSAAVRTPLGHNTLGAYQLQLSSPQPGLVQGQLQDTGGVLDLNGQFLLQNAQWRFDGSVKHDLPDQMQRFFRMFGQDDGERIRFHFPR